jgi:hypothetical protein
MRNLILAGFAVTASLLATGCPIAGCGGYEGGGNRAYERSSEMLLLCENGGFVATLDTELLEGRYVRAESGAIIGTRGDDASLAFELTDNGDGTATAPALGTEAWAEVDLDQVAADHANVLCNDLATRAWWGAQ